MSTKQHHSDTRQIDGATIPVAGTWAIDRGHTEVVRATGSTRCRARPSLQRVAHVRGLIERPQLLDQHVDRDWCTAAQGQRDGQLARSAFAQNQRPRRPVDLQRPQHAHPKWAADRPLVTTGLLTSAASVEADPRIEDGVEHVGQQVGKDDTEDDGRAGSRVEPQVPLHRIGADTQRHPEPPGPSAPIVSHLDAPRRRSGFLRQHDVADVDDDTVVQPQDGGGVIGRRASLHGRPRVDVVLHMAVRWADVDLVPRDV